MLWLSGKSRRRKVCVFLNWAPPPNEYVVLSLQLPTCKQGSQIQRQCVGINWGDLSACVRGLALSPSWLLFLSTQERMSPAVAWKIVITEPCHTPSIPNLFPPLSAMPFSQAQFPRVILKYPLPLSTDTHYSPSLPFLPPGYFSDLLLPLFAIHLFIQ